MDGMVDVVQDGKRVRVTGHLPPRVYEQWTWLKKRYGVDGDRRSDGDSEMFSIMVSEFYRQGKKGGKTGRLIRIERKLNMMIALMLGAFGGKVQVSPATVEAAKTMVAELLDLLGDGEDDDDYENGI